MRKITSIGLFLLFVVTAIAQTPAILAIRNYREKQEALLAEQFLSFLSIPDIPTVPADIERNTTRIMEMMKQRAIQNVQLLYPVTKDAPPAVYGEVLVPGATQTIFFYAHYDGQPVDSTKWAKGTHPFKPVIINGALKEQNEFIQYSTKGEQK